MDEPPRPRRSPRILLGLGRTVVALVAVAVLAGTGYAWALYRSFSTDLATSEVLAARPTERAPASAPRRSYTALLVGMDSRTDAHGDPLSPELLAAIHAGDDGGELHTDTIMLVRVPADPGAPVVTVSFPRDSYVPIADGSGRHKINSAYGRGYRAEQDRLEAQGVSGADLDRRSREAGRATLVATVEQASGTTIDHYAEVNLAGFVELTDTLGGVPVCLNRPVDDRAYSGVDLPAGPQTVTGGTALAFVRQRHGLDGGDLDRITRQQAYMAGLTHQVLATGTLTDPGRVADLLGVVTRYVVLDSGWNLEQLVGQLGTLAGADVVFRTIPTVRPDLSTPSDGMAVEVDDAAVRAFVHTVLYSDARAGETPGPTTDTPDATRIRASGPTETTGPAPTTAPTTTVPTTTVPTTTVPTTAVPTPADPWRDRPVIDAAAVPCVN
ncbi:LCP family protein [Pseudonocardia pini]|uniref:LCP family protein n=1 Tax=Pseudonocardia pini TaxID=2758030 RepID=UPI0015F01884|nr:LCP family protein [Pseudonocardia pini]